MNVYEAFRQHPYDRAELAPVPRSDMSSLRDLTPCLAKIRKDWTFPDTPSDEISDSRFREMLGLTKDGVPTLAAQLLFGLYPQCFFPLLCPTAVVVPGVEMGDPGPGNVRFLDNSRIVGTLPEMFEGAMAFVMRNMRVEALTDEASGARKERTEYPIEAVREAVLNALIHRDYSAYSLNMPVRIVMYEDRLEIDNPGGQHGNSGLDELGSTSSAARNPLLAAEMEALGLAKNRALGIHIMRCAMQDYGLPMPEFESDSWFRVTLRNTLGQKLSLQDKSLLYFCRTPRTRREIATFLGLKSVGYAMRTRVVHLVARGLLVPTLPDTPQSPRQTYTASIGKATL